ncbi:hypothetical protein [Candidatus Viadribacter manganicus]|uniref:hypothetical protein n=1 Tax=Candidatus Viadribacter manganicus TaxID=1759059 RepID=UPI0012EA402E|nr:hypothetical protein [Candidatus Viadribacter manganicus]
MTTEPATAQDTEPRRSLWWWLLTITAPIGIIGGPLGIADMLSGLIEWHGPVGFLVSYWDRIISDPLHNVLHYVAAFIPALRFLDGFALDYLTLGVLQYSAFARSLSILRPHQPGPIPLDHELLTAAIVILGWPLVFYFSAFFSLINDRVLRPILVLSTAPFLIFLLLWIVNLTLT